MSASSARPEVARALVEALTPGSGIGLAVHDADLRLLLISPSLAELSGLPAEELRLEPAVEAGRERGWLISVFPLEREGRDLIAVLALDVTESRRTFRRLEESRALLAEAQRMAGVGSWSWEVPEDRWSWSDELFRLTGLDPAAGVPAFETVLAAVPEDRREAVRRATAGALGDGAPYEVTFPLVLPSGERRVLLGRGVPVRDASGAVVRVDGFAQDVTERSRVEAQQRTAATLGGLGLSGMPLHALQRHADAMTEALRAAYGDGGDDAFAETIATIVASAAQRLRAEAAVAEHSVARGRLVAQTLDAEDRTRRGISEALHDGPLQDLLALGHEVARLEPAEEGDAFHLGRVRDGIVRAARQIREAMLDLHPVVLEAGGLDSALRAVCSQQAGIGGYDCAVELQPEAAGPRDDLVLALARELLHNVAKHAAAGRVTVRVSRSSEAVVLEVTDDGAGIAPGRLRAALGQGHIGVASSVQRAEAIGGSLSVGPRGDGARGTRAVAVLPIA